VKRLLTALIAAALLPAVPASAAGRRHPSLVHDGQTGHSRLPALYRPVPGDANPDDGYSQPDTQIEPSIAVNPANPRNAVAVYQEGRFADGGAYTIGYATTFDAGRTWTYGELPKLTRNGSQGGPWERASDAVVAFGPHNLVYANALDIDFNSGNGLHSGVSVNVSRDGGRHWSAPVFIQDDSLGVPATNDKNWIVVDTSSAPGHHAGRVYVVWDRVAPILYDYCDHDCDRLSNWLPDMQQLPGIVSPDQGVGAIPVIQRDGGLGVVVETIAPGLPPALAAPSVVYMSAPLAGSTPYPAPLAFLPPVQIAADDSSGVAGQRASGGLPSAAVDPRTGTLYAAWDDARFRADGVNDAVISRSSDDGLTWSPPRRVDQGAIDDKIDHYDVAVAAGSDGRVHLMWRQRDESGRGPLFSPLVDTFYAESYDGAATFTRPLRVDTVPSDVRYDAFSRGGAFEGDYNEIASWGPYTYVVRCQGRPRYRGEPAALAPADATSLRLARRGHQHQAAWVAVVQDR
jgi:hypothetical protein